MNKKSTEELEKVLQSTHPNDISLFFSTEQEEMMNSNNTFGSFFKDKIKKRNLQLHEIFIKANMSDTYGYKLLSGEKHTNKRDTILKLCFLGELNLEETQTALKLYGLSPLYARISRDALLITMFNQRIRDLETLNGFLEENGFDKLHETNS